MTVMIGVDPQKASHTAVALDDAERPLGEVRVRATAGQLERLLEWAAPFGDRTWAIEGAGKLGYLLAQQLVAAGERVVDVQPKLAARVRLLATGDVNKNDPNDARSVAVAALRAASVPEVHGEDHVKVMKVWAKRHRDLSSHRTRLACRLHAMLCELSPGGFSGEISAAQAARLLDDLEPVGAVAAARVELASELVADLIRLDEQLRDTKKRITAAVKASQTTLTGLFGVGPIVAAIVIGDVGDIGRFPTRDHFAAYNGTAPIEMSSGGRRKVFRLWRRGNRRLNHAVHMAAVTQIRHRHSPGRAYYDRKIAEGHTGKEAIRALKRRISDAIYTRIRDDAARTGRPNSTGPGGNRGTTLKPVRPAHTPNTSSSVKPLPDPSPPYERPTTVFARRGRRHPHPSEKLVDKQRGLDRCGSIRPAESTSTFPSGQSDVPRPRRLQCATHRRAGTCGLRREESVVGSRDWVGRCDECNNQVESASVRLTH
jgi:transposase